MSAKNKRKRWNIYEHSKYRMVAYFKNLEGKGKNGKDEACYFYSFDWKSGYSRTLDPQLGLQRLRKKVQEYGARANFILIYDRKTNTLLESYFEGDPVELTPHHSALFTH